MCSGDHGDGLHAVRYRAVASRDARYDGQFVVAVHSTRIYCRPSCPARTPRESGVTFYPTSAAAHMAGYRACKRCLPEATPGSPAWDVREDTAARAMRMIVDGVVERDGVGGLAAALGYSERQLGRILQAELGAGPKALSRAHRAQTARLLLTQSDLRIADIAFASGFTSVRQFNDTVREVFCATPTEICSRRRTASADGGFRIHLPARAPFDAAGVFAWLSARALPGMEEGSADRYARVLRLPGGPASVVITAASGVRGTGLEVAARLTATTDLPVLVARVRSLFDLDSDPVAVDAHLGSLPELAPRVAAVPGIRVPGTIDAEELVIRTLVGQQVSVAAARAALTRLVDVLGEEAPEDVASGMRLFPTMDVLAERVGEVLRGPVSRIATVQRVAAAFASGALTVTRYDTLDALRERLLAVRGIGPWTADYVAMRVRHHPDLLLHTDVAVRRGAQALGIRSDRRALSVWSERAAPWRSSLTMHLWRASAAQRKDRA